MKRIDLETVWLIIVLAAFVSLAVLFFGSVITMLQFGLSSLWVAFIAALALTALLASISWARIVKE